VMWEKRFICFIIFTQSNKKNCFLCNFFLTFFLLFSSRFSFNSEFYESRLNKKI